MPQEGVGTAQELPGAQLSRQNEELITGRLQDQCGMSTQALKRLFAGPRALGSPCHSAHDLDQQESWTVQLQLPLGDGCEKRGALGMEAIPRIVCGDPDVGVQRQHGSATFKAIPVGGQNLGGRWARRGVSQGLRAQLNPLCQPLRR